MRVRLARAARDELDVRKQRTGVMHFDDLLTHLSATLEGAGGEVAAARLRKRYGVVLVDEFQDTDPVQWRIMQTAFGDGKTTLVLIGDPKQAIYAFRGADVYAYIEAAQTAGAQATLTVNRRSDQGLLDAYDALFNGAKLGHEGIVYRQVSAAPANRVPRFHGAPDPAPLRVRVVPRAGLTLTGKGYAQIDSARAYVVRDVAADIVSLLRSGATIDGAGPIRPGQIAVLTRTNDNAAAVRDELEALDVPAVINGAGSVFGTEPAREWLRVLEAIERPSYPPRARSAALTSILGWTTEQVAAADEDAWEEVHRRLHHWARVLRVKGVASLMEAITLEEGLPARLLAMADGERRMTDLRHVGELLHAAAMTEQMGATALTAWLRQRVLEAARDRGNEERSRRLESDADAVQVLTVHRSKGLEFPVVYCPDLWDRPRIRTGNPVAFHDAAGRRTIDVGLEGPQWAAHLQQHVDEERGEDLRLAYVALTRAKHQAVVWWAGSWDSRNSALSRLLFARDGDGNVASSGDFVPTDEAATRRFQELADAAPGRFSVAPAVSGATVSWPGDVTATSELSASSFDRDAGLVVAAHVLQRHHRRHLRGARGERAGGGRRRRRVRAARAAGRGRRRRRAASGAVAARRHAGGRRGRDLGPPRVRVDGLRGAGSRRWSWWRRSKPRRRAGGSSSATSRVSSPGCAPRSRRRSGRWRAASRCATSRAPTGSTSSTSSCPWSAATTRAARR